MLIEVEAFTGEASPARRALASRIATESLGWLDDVVRGVVMRVPSGRHDAAPNADLACSVVVVLRDGRRYDAIAAGVSFADALERACHDLRREIAAEIGRPLRRRRAGAGEGMRAGALAAHAERRAGGE
jgi:hypothetical protein